MGPVHRLPPLTALRAFEAVARKLSFARAAEELHVTKAAVAQQVRALEQEIGVPLVARSGRGLALTEAGAAGAPGLAEGFAVLARAARAMREAKGRRFLVINSSPSFAATWLVGRIGRFKGRHPEIDVLLDANPIDDTLDSGTADALIRWGAGDFAGLATTLLFKENVFPVCSPDLLGGDNPLRSPEDLARHTLLHLEWSSAYPSWPAWSDWLKAAGARSVEARHGVFFNNMAMAMRAAAQGQGVALSSLAIAADELAAGRLVAPFSTAVATPFGYYFLCRPDEAQAPRIKALRDFLVEEAALSAA
ncbi:LysR family transcriptional regulator [Roseiarcus fermentans]|uniref:LysR family transcriptional regulator n=1 Tax=Roseiarcus fermentans TaxID=1473586 RepID=A0A366FHX0_9HYPH|nr:transcriptional regulator GcvA [Roseiarcus fermentans]RBP14258.1 LysR family transcriptional regulator [Roseiarcus fermentans]